MDSDDDYFVDDSDMDEEEDELDDSCSSTCKGVGENNIIDRDDVDYECYFEMSNIAKINNTRQQVEEDYTILTIDEAFKYMNDYIEEVNVITQLPSSITRLLLKHFNWDKDKLIERFYDGDEEKLFFDAGIVNPFNEPHAYSSTSKIELSISIQSIECKICFLPVSADNMTGLQCGHTFCSSCWISYLTSKIMDEGIVEMISCAAHGCNILADVETIMKLLKDESVKLKYQKLLLNSFLEYNKLLHSCTSPNCSHVIKVDILDAKPVTCKCRNVMCSACGQNWHNPVECNLLKKWLQKCSDDSETFNWIATNTKDCPKCRQTINKDGGCNDMICKRCNHQFCWNCMESFNLHLSSYICNRFVSDDSKDKSRLKLERYLFYFNRYKNHMQSLKFEHQLYSSIEHKMEELERHDVTSMEGQFLKFAVDVLCQCRQTLMYTYVFAYYLCQNNQSIMFENNQDDLEKATEILSEYLERDINSDQSTSIRQKVTDKYKYCESRRKALLDHILEGNDENLWKYQNL